MKNLLCSQVLVLLFLSSKAFAVDPVASTVKIRSGLCQGDQSKFRGSGLLFAKDDGIYVLTSEHIVLHTTTSSMSKICMSVENGVIGKKSATLVQADFGTGLALLKVSSESLNIDIPNFEFFNGDDVSSNEAAVTFGFPFDSSVVFTGATGTILNARSDRAFIPLVPTVVEITASHGEYGMSGGPVFSSDGEKFVGVLSHQFLQIVPGGASEVGEYSEKVVAKADHVFAISKRTVHDWLVKIFQPSGARTATFVRDWVAQLAGKDNIVYSSGLKFEIVGNAHTSTGNVGGSSHGGSSGHGIGGSSHGGGSGHGVGGSSGHGVGGESGDEDSSFAIEVSLDLESHLAEWDFDGRESWVQSIKSQLIRNQRIQIPFFLRKAPSGPPQRGAIESLAQFVMELKNAQSRPVTMILDGAVQSYGSRLEASNTLKTTGLGIKGSVESFRKNINPDQVLIRQYLSDLDMLADILISGDWLAIEIAWIRDLEGRAEELKLLINIDFDQTVDLIQNIKAVKTNLAKLVVE